MSVVRHDCGIPHPGVKVGAFGWDLLSRYRTGSMLCAILSLKFQLISEQTNDVAIAYSAVGLSKT